LVANSILYAKLSVVQQTPY